jgi:hypothetical protein
MRAVAVVLGVLASAGLARSASELAPGVDLIPGKFVAGTQPDGNTVVFTTPDGSSSSTRAGIPSTRNRSSISRT